MGRAPRSQTSGGTCNQTGLESLLAFFAKTTLAAVAGDKLASALKPVDGQHTVVGCSPLQRAMEVLYFKADDLVKGQHGGLLSLAM